MTKEEILAMEAGCQLDELIATKIMGWHKSAEDKDFGFYWLKHEKTCKDMIKDWRFQPSTDISAAWQVVEKLRQAVFSIYLDGDWKWACCNEYALDSAANEMQWLGELTICDTAPEAICKAALLAKLAR